jgi:hypothetical protein
VHVRNCREEEAEPLGDLAGSPGKRITGELSSNSISATCISMISASSVRVPGLAVTVCEDQVGRFGC